MKVTFKGLASPMMEKIYRLEKEMFKREQVDCPVRHFFAPGIYGREITIPAGVVLSGAVHKTEHLVTISKGRIEVMTDEGMKIVSAPATFVSKPGIKRIGFAFEETVWTTYHDNPDNCRDMDVLVERLTTSKNCELLESRLEREAVCLSP